MVVKQFIGVGLLTAFITYLAYQVFYHLRNMQDGALIGALIFIVALAVALKVVQIIRD